MTSATVLAMLAVVSSFGRADNPVGPVAIPFELLQSRHMAVEIKVNGQGPYRVIFDTGAPITLLGSRIHKEAKLPKGEGAMPMMMGMQGQVKVKELQVGAFKAKDVNVIVMDHPTIKAMARFFGPIDGILGFPFFARFRTTLDYQAKTMTLEPVDYEPGDLMATLMKTMMRPSNKAEIRTYPTTALLGLGVGKDEADEESGVEITYVLPDSAAAKAGLQVGDRLLELDGTWTEERDDVLRAVSRLKPGREVVLGVSRDGKRHEVRLTPAAGW